MTRDEKEPQVGIPEEGELPRWGGDYRDPPDVPRDEIWNDIVSRLGPGPGRAVSGTPSGLRVGRLGLTAAATVVLAAGVGLGRLTVDSPTVGTDDVAGISGESPTGAVGGPEPTGAVRTVALDHLGRTGTFLAGVRADARAGRVEEGVGAWGSGLLTETRLLLDSDAAADPGLRSLLEDLELILAQVAVLRDFSEGEALSAEDELELIAKGVEARDVLGRIDAVVPRRSGPEGS